MKKIYSLVVCLMNGTVTMNQEITAYNNLDLALKAKDAVDKANKENEGVYSFVREINMYENENEVPILSKPKNVFQFFTIEDAEKHNKTTEGWKYALEKFKKYYKKTWIDIDKEYTIEGIEDNGNYNDYYFILIGSDPFDVKYILVNNPQFYEEI